MLRIDYHDAALLAWAGCWCCGAIGRFAIFNVMTLSIRLVRKGTWTTCGELDNLRDRNLAEFVTKGLIGRDLRLINGFDEAHNGITSISDSSAQYLL
jgi:hypothetical protein